MGMQANILVGTVSPGGGGGGLPGVTDPFVDFTVGDGQAGTPANGATVFHVATFDGQSLANKRLLVSREGILLNYNTPVQTNGDIRRYNSGGLGGFTILNGLFFATGDRWQIYIIGVDNTIET
jgi:hypothetical protein